MCEHLGFVRESLTETALIISAWEILKGKQLTWFSLR